MRDARVPTVRARLSATGDLPGAVRPGASDTSRVFDPALAGAVRAFQRRHLLADDGTLGAGTLAAMNVPIRTRIDQIRVNLERARWIFHDLADSFVIVNVAAFRTYLVAKGQVVWSARCQVGKEARQTPIFRDDMRYVVFNPTWTVPPGILAKDILPSLQRGDLGVLQRKRLEVIDRQGRVVSPGSVRWSQVRASSCPYTFRQDPGPNNALGRVKFMFPNAYSVYLHDTPSRDLFESPSRAFSSGCIRVEHPLELAERVLADPKWSAAAIERTVDGGKTVTVNLRRPLPVLLLYWTAFPTGEGRRVGFARDIYGRDAPIQRALEGPSGRAGSR
jgi:murein L,D-transpeptidase YcbB/YkuD